MIEKPFKLLLAEDADLNNLPLPGWLSRKLDGVRYNVRGGVLLSRTNTPIPNKAIQAKFGHLEHLDGEIIYGDPTAPDCYSRTYSATSTINGTADNVKFYVFDHTERTGKLYRDRFEEIQRWVREANMPEVVLVEQVPVHTPDTVMTFESSWLEEGYEGVMLRDPNALYKQGRSTLAEAILLKIKRRDSAEGIVLEFLEAMENTNEATVSRTGNTKRSSAKAGKKAKGTLGAIRMRGINGRFKDVEFKVGFSKGFSHKIRQEMWNNPEKYINQCGTYDFFPIGCKDKPRHGQWKGLRDINEVEK